MMPHEEAFPDSQDAHGAGIALDSVRITLDLYRSGKSGLPFETLRKFCDPIIAHYQLDLSGSETEQVTAENLQSITLLLDVLETGCMFWEYCSLEEDEKQKAYPALRTNLLGHRPSQDDLMQFPLLLAAMEDRWNNLAEHEHHTTHSFQSLEENERSTSLLEATVEVAGERYGPEKLEIPEAFALFTRPMLEDEQIMEDPDLLEDLMVRAQAYWDLAHAPGSAHPSLLEELFSHICNGATPKNVLAKEAEVMLARFHELFPERK